VYVPLVTYSQYSTIYQIRTCLFVDHLKNFQVPFQVRIFTGDEKLPTRENM